jgi:hypothetical protein
MALNPFSEEQIIARLQFENPWWATSHLLEINFKMTKKVLRLMNQIDSILNNVWILMRN